ncbi:hypothetical protein [Spirochaeta dissipatitropha]
MQIFICENQNILKKIELAFNTGAAAFFDSDTAWTKPSAFLDIPGVHGFTIKEKMFCLHAETAILPVVCALAISSGSRNIGKSISEARVCYLGIFNGISEESALISAILPENNTDIKWYPDILIPPDSEFSVKCHEAPQTFIHLLMGLQRLISTHSMLAFHLRPDAETDTVKRIMRYVQDHAAVSSFPDWEIDEQDRSELQEINQTLRLSRQRSEILARRLQEFRVRERSYDQRILDIVRTEIMRLQTDKKTESKELSAELRIQIYERLEAMLGALKK